MAVDNIAADELPVLDSADLAIVGRASDGRYGKVDMTAIGANTSLIWGTTGFAAGPTVAEISAAAAYAATAADILAITQDKITRFAYTATASQTTFSGLDTGGHTLSYIPGNEVVTLNGAVLTRGEDYTATTGNTIVLTAFAAAGDELRVMSYAPINGTDLTALDEAIGTASGRQFATLALLLADAVLTYSAGSHQVVAGDYLTVLEENSKWKVAASGATDHDKTTAGGVKLYRATISTAWDAQNRSQIRSVPDIPQRVASPTWTPPGGAPYFNIIFAPDGPSSTATIWRSVLLGVGVGSRLTTGERLEAIGDGAMRFTTVGERNTAIGSISQQWAGHIPNVGDDLADVFHDLWYPTLPSDAAWDVDGMETDNPGIRASVAAPTFAAVSDENARNVSVGRDSLLHLIRGTENVAIGYQAHTHAYDGVNYNTAIGTKALQNGLYTIGWTAIGRWAALRAQQGSNSTALGRSAGSFVISASESVYLGYLAGGAVSGGDKSIFIGSNAGDGLAGSVANTLVIQSGAGRTPLISGDLSTGVLGVNVQPTGIKGSGLHVRDGDSGVTPNSGANVGVFEGTGTTGISILTDAGGTTQINFGDPATSNAGAVRYLHTSNELTLRANNTLNITVGANTLGFYGHAAAAQPTTVAANSAAIIAALVSIGIFAP